MPIRLHIYPFRFPHKPTLHLDGWNYTDREAIYDLTLQNRDAVIAHLKEHFVDTPWATSRVLGSGAYDADGNMIREPDTTAFEEWLGQWEEARQYRVFVNVGRSFAGSPIGTPLFEKEVRTWTKFWAQHLLSRGIQPEQLGLLLADEPAHPKQDEIILAWAKAIHSAGTGIRVWEDPRHRDPYKANQEMMKECDILCPNRLAFLRASERYREYFLKLREEGKTLAFYSCSGPARLLDPYAYHRLQAWTCWRYGAKASYFWAFWDSGGGSSWNEYPLKRSVFVPFFLDSKSVTAGKHMEAIREGVEDFEYIAMLKKMIEKREREGGKSEAMAKARRILQEGVKQVCGALNPLEFKWHTEMDRGVADRVREEILEVMSALR